MRIAVLAALGGLMIAPAGAVAARCPAGGGLSVRGELAWLVPAPGRGNESRIVLRRPGSPPRRIAQEEATDLSLDGPDRPLVVTGLSWGNGSYASVAGVGGTIVAVAETEMSRYWDCEWIRLTTYDARTGGALRAIALRSCGPDAPAGRWTSAITADGVIAWVAGGALWAAGPDGRSHEPTAARSATCGPTAPRSTGHATARRDRSIRPRNCWYIAQRNGVPRPLPPSSPPPSGGIARGGR